VTGYTRRIEKIGKDGRQRFEWEYSTQAVEILQEYLRLFPDVIDIIEQDVDAEFYDTSALISAMQARAAKHQHAATFAAASASATPAIGADKPAAAQVDDEAGDQIVLPPSPTDSTTSSSQPSETPSPISTPNGTDSPASTPVLKPEALGASLENIPPADDDSSDDEEDPKKPKREVRGLCV